MDLEIKRCPLANEDHEKSRRQYAHVFHRRDTICVADAFWRLPERTQVAIVLHEIGHRLAGMKASEKQANRAIERATGIHIHYRTGKYGELLEWITLKNKYKAKELLGL